MSAKRAWGVMGFAAEGPQNCMSGLIQNRMRKDANHLVSNANQSETRSQQKSENEMMKQEGYRM